MSKFGDDAMLGGFGIIADLLMHVEMPSRNLLLFVDNGLSDLIHCVRAAILDKTVTQQSFRILMADALKKKLEIDIHKSSGIALLSISDESIGVVMLTADQSMGLMCGMWWEYARLKGVLKCYIYVGEKIRKVTFSSVHTLFRETLRWCEDNLFYLYLGKNNMYNNLASAAISGL